MHGERSGTVPRCDDVERVAAAPELYRDAPIYVANEMPVERVQAWATTRSGFEAIWIDRDRLGWITVAFSRNAAARQVELEEAFPDVGAVAVGVDWTMSELEALQSRVGEVLSAEGWSVGTSVSVQQGVVTIGLGIMHPERVAILEEHFGGERVCVEGMDPSEAPAPGPQAQEGDGWRLLADERGAGQPYRTGIATDEESYDRLWRGIGLTGARPAVDFQDEVVIWFGAVHSGSCPNLRLDDVVVDAARSLVHAVLVLVDGPHACDADANPYAYLVAVAREKLPDGPFAIQLGAEGPPAGVPEERTMVDVDLSRPGAVARPDQVHGDPSLPEPFALASGDEVEPGFEFPYRLNVHCGTEWLGVLNDLSWRTDVPPGSTDFVPAEWMRAVGPDQVLVVSILLQTDPEPTITATLNGREVVYRPVAGDPPGCD